MSDIDPYRRATASEIAAARRWTAELFADAAEPTSDDDRQELERETEAEYAHALAIIRFANDQTEGGAS